MRQASVALVVVALAGLASCLLPEATLNDTSGRGGTDAGGIAGKGGASGAGGAGNRDATAGSAGSGGFDAGNTGGGVGADANDSGGGGRSDAAPDVSADVNDGAATDSSRDALADASADPGADPGADISPDAVEDTSDVVIADSAPDAPADADDAVVADSPPDAPADSASDDAADAPAFDVGPDTMADAGDAVPTDSAQDTVADAADGGLVSRWPDSPTAFCSNGTTAVACNTLSVGQDGTYAINVPGYSTASGVVTDSVTQLAWQDVPSGAMSYAAASTYCATQTTGGRTWRLPTFLELLSTADYGSYDPASRVGQYGSLTYFWSSDAAFNTANEWVFAASNGSLQPLAKTANFPIVRCVSGAPFVGSFVAQPDGTILDQRTNLYWGPDIGSMTWANAISACESHSQGSFSNFRLPSLKELATLVVPGTNPTYDPVFTDIPATARYASSTPSAEMITSYWVVQLDSGNFNPLWTISSQTARVRCVR